MIYEGNMRIGFLGGHKAGSNRGGVAEDYESKNLPWEIKTEKPREITSGFQNTISFSIGRDYVYYNLMIMKKNGIMKFFYVLKGMDKDEIESQLNKYWDESDILGYDFD
jgi:hypothetical protein